MLQISNLRNDNHVQDSRSSIEHFGTNIRQKENVIYPSDLTKTPTKWFLRGDLLFLNCNVKWLSFNDSTIIKILVLFSLSSHLKYHCWGTQNTAFKVPV